MDELIKIIFRSPKTFSYTLFFIFFVIIPLIKALKNLSITSRTVSSGGFSVEGLYVPPLEFYKTLKNRLNVRGIDSMVKSIDNLPENGPFGNQRQYMKIQKSGIIFYVCAFRLGSAQIFTYHEVAPLMLIQRMLSSIPILGSIFKGMFFPDTLYKRDVAGAIKGMILEDFRKIVNEQGDNKGIRELAESNLAHLRTIL